MTKVTTEKLYCFHKEIASYYFKSINEVFLTGIFDRDNLSCKSNLVGFWKIKKLKV